jgi:hypothetical protein
MRRSGTFDQVEGIGTEQEHAFVIDRAFLDKETFDEVKGHHPPMGIIKNVLFLRSSALPAAIVYNYDKCSCGGWSTKDNSLHRQSADTPNRPN